MTGLFHELRALYGELLTLSEGNIMSALDAYSIIAADIAEVLRTHAVMVVDSKGYSFETMADIIYNDWDEELEQVAEAAMAAGVSPCSQQAAAKACILTLLIEQGVLKGAARPALTFESLLQDTRPMCNDICILDDSVLVRCVGVAETDEDFYYIVRGLVAKQFQASAVGSLVSLNGCYPATDYARLDAYFEQNGAPKVDEFIIRSHT